MEKMFDFFKRILSGSNEAEVRKLMKIVDAIEAQEAKMQALTDAELRGQTALFRERLQKGETLDDLMVDALAAVREGEDK